MSLVSSNSAFLTNPDMLFLKDYWILIAATGGALGFLIKKCWEVVNKINKIDCLDNDMGSVKKDIANIKGKTSTIEKLLRGLVTNPNNTTVPGLVQSNSPLQLTSKGFELLDNCGFKKIYKTHKDDFLFLIKKQNPKLKYDVQEMAMSVIIDVSNKNFMKPLKKYAFEHGLNLFDILKVSSIFLRDEIIKELNITD